MFTMEDSWRCVSSVCSSLTTNFVDVLGSYSEKGNFFIPIQNSHYVFLCFLNVDGTTVGAVEERY